MLQEIQLITNVAIVVLKLYNKLIWDVVMVIFEMIDTWADMAISVLGYYTKLFQKVIIIILICQVATFCLIN